MSHSRTELSPRIEEWTKEDVHQWLMTQVKVHQTDADKFLEEDVLGEYLVKFDKKDILDLGIKHGPAVKIISHLERWKQGTKSKSQFPAYMEKWTKEQVSEWLLQHVKIYSKYAERLKEEDVSGDCLVCFRKQDFLDVDVKSGPAVNILAELRELNSKLEPELQPSPHSNADKEDLSAAQKCPKPQPHLAQASATKQPESLAKEEVIKPLKEETPGKEEAPKLLTLGAERKQSDGVTAVLNPPTLIQNTLEDLKKKDLKKFRFHLRHYKTAQRKPIPWSKLEKKDTMDLADVMIEHYGGQEALQVTLQILPQINNSELARYLEDNMGQLKPQCGSQDVSRREVNQGDKLKKFLSCGGNSLDNYDGCVFVVNKSGPEDLQFLNKLKLFYVLDFDPNSTAPGGLCHSYRESRMANLHTPSQYQGQTDVVMKDLNLYKQTSLVFRNGRSSRLLPSSDSSSVVLKQKDEDFMAALDILCLNQCENIHDENSPEFRDFKIKVEEEFFRGGKVKWWNFYFCDKRKAEPFIKRDKYENIKKMIQSQSKKPQNTCVQLNLFHDPGCGGTTLAMHVMWDLRQDFRCAVLKDNTLPKAEVAIQVRKLMKLESDKSSPVLLLVDDSKETENAQDLVNCIRKVVEEDCSSRTVDGAPNGQVIILNCVRSHSPKKKYQQHNATECQYITKSLTQKEQDDFEEKLQELKETHTKHENFYSFMIMKSNFDKKYIDGLVQHTLEKFDMATKEAQLFAFLALLNTHVAESEISISLCEDYLGMKFVHWREDNIMDRMKPYSKFLIIDTFEEWGRYKGIRILHHSIASASLEELEKSYNWKVSEIANAIHRCDLFFRVGVVKHALMRLGGDERQTFSPLIEKQNQKSAQTLARCLGIKEQDFPEAQKLVENGKNIKEHPYTVDTTGQVKLNIQSEKQKTSCYSILSTSPEEITSQRANNPELNSEKDIVRTLCQMIHIVGDRIESDREFLAAIESMERRHRDPIRYILSNIINTFCTYFSGRNIIE